MVGMAAKNILTIEQDRSGCLPVEPYDCFNGSGLSGTIRANHRDELTFVDMEREIPDDPAYSRERH